MGCSDSKIEEEDYILPPTDPETEARNPVVFTNNANPEPPKRSRSQLIPSIKQFSEIDSHARSVPDDVKLTPPTLVKYLVEPCTRDLDVIRVFYVWICSNIRYDVDVYNGKKSPSNAPQTVLNKKLAVCQGYSELFALFCRMVKIPVKVITGHSKGFAYNANRRITEDTETNHAWNAVYTQGEWRFIECTWGAGRMNDDGKWEKAYTDRHFMQDPDKFINAHFPLLENAEENSSKWQILKEPITLEEFASRIKLYEAAQDWDVDFHPHKHVQLETKDVIEIFVRAKNVPLTDVGAHMYDREGEAYDTYLMVQRLPNHVFKLTVKPPKSTKYKITILGRISPENDGGYATLVDYMVEGQDISGPIDPFPDHFGAWGVRDPTKFGIDGSMTYRTVFASDSGRMSLPIKTIGNSRFTHKLVHAEKAIEDADDFIIREFQKNLMVLHIRFPFKGFYTLKIYTKSNSSDQKMFTHATNLLIDCHNPADIGPFPKTFAETDRQECILLEPGEKDVPANTEVAFTIESPILQCAMVKSSSGSTKMQGNNKNEWSATVTTPDPGEKITIYGSETPDRYLALYQFRSEKDPLPSTRAKIETPKSQTQSEFQSEDDFEFKNLADSNLTID
ncbi:hypothetical protein LOTGIDRAFT_169022 [Lottia gigantea]|uniref:Transglutaminase-like domain-containing protein n=1 Tax=Lottia gigantea TaxID=225164 RepID=V3ZSB0_LOTGI|nr:hypothetical protein LOTGIDRAFT_169022 [Lottia gigantea]ESO83786.1 hypothetical protein LOTGIDRAFT_169022 [Lottia gigantea]